MRILYLSDQDLDNNSGVAKKIIDQAKEWVKFGHDVSILSLETLSFFDLQQRVIKTDGSFSIKKKGQLFTFLRLFYSSYKLKNVLKKQNFDIVYMRYRLYMPFFYSAFNNEKIIVEINSDDEIEYKMRSKLLSFYNQFFKKKQIDAISAFVCVSNELERLYAKYNKKSIVIANGTKVLEYEFIEKTNNLKPQIFFVGKPGHKWHGIDKIIYLSTQLKKIDFHIIGEEGENSENLIFYGYCNHDKVVSLLKNADVALSTLSLHEKNMEEASPLKSRQYLSMGIPIIYAYEDTDIIGDFSFCLKLNNNEKNVVNSIEKINSFITHCFNNIKVRIEAREFAINHLHTEQKELKRTTFFSQIKL